MTAEVELARIQQPAPMAAARPRWTVRTLVHDWRIAVAVSMLATAGIVALLAPALAPYHPTQLATGVPLQPPGGGHLMGTDVFGRDQLSRVLYGTRISVSVSVLVVIGSLGVGLPLGLIAGYAGGRVDFLLGRAIDVMFAFPSLLLALVLTTVLGVGLRTAMIALAIVYMPVAVRFVRGAALVERNRDYVTAARVCGVSPFRIVWRHILPNILSPLLVVASSIMAFTVLAEAALSYLGLGAQPPSSSWGTMLTENQAYLTTAPYLVLFPGLAISYLVIALNLLGDGMRDYLDPRQRGTR